MRDLKWDRDPQWDPKWKGITPLHPVKDWQKVKRFVRDVEASAEFTPILVEDCDLLAGTHRWVANVLLARRNRTTARIRVVELQLLPEKVKEDITDALKWNDYWHAQNVFDYWWWDEDGHLAYHLVRSDKHDPTPETEEVAASRRLRELHFECEDCGECFPDKQRRDKCCSL